MGKKDITIEDLKSQIFQKIGYATMCWNPRPSGVFDSTECAKTGNEIMELVEQYAASLNRQGWTRVEDGLPESIWNDTEQEYYKRFSKQVNVFIDNGYVTTCAYNRETKKWFTGGLTKETGYREVAEGNKVTHWMPLPTKPNDI